MREIKEILYRRHLENDHRKINILEEIEILKAVSLPDTFSMTLSTEEANQDIDYALQPQAEGQEEQFNNRLVLLICLRAHERPT